MTVDLKALQAPWNVVVEETTAGALRVPNDCSYALRSTATGLWRAYADSGEDGIDLPPHIDAYRVLDVHTGQFGPIIERPPTTARRWAVGPPNDETRIAVLWGDNFTVGGYEGRFAQGHCEDGIAWMLWDDWLAFLTTPLQVVEVTAEDVGVVARENDADHGELNFLQDACEAFAHGLNRRLSAAAEGRRDA